MATPSKTSAKAPAASKGKTVKSKAVGIKKPAAKTPIASSRPAATAAPAAEFILFAPEAKEVLVTGEFCDWLGEGCRMRRFKDGIWKKSLKLKPGRYEYRFIVDGHWWTDPENPQRQPNPFGQDNSVLIIT